MMIYLDHNATTPVDPRVLEVMLPLFTGQFGNPASKHAAGQAAARLVATARSQVAALLGTDRRSVVFTSGATEAIHLGLRGAYAITGRSRVVIGATEHAAVFAAARAAVGAAGQKISGADGFGRGHSMLEDARGPVSGDDAGSPRGGVVTARVHPDGTIDMAALRRLLDRDVALVVVTVANNETGVLNRISAVAQAAHHVGALVACDVTQAVGRVPVRLDAWGVDLAFCSAHKLGGPKGVGALVVPRALQDRMPALIDGGGQERGLRAGTLNTPGIVGFGAACAIAGLGLGESARRQAGLVRALRELLSERVDLRVVGEGAARLPNTICLRFPGAPADAVQARAPQVLVSAGSACASGRDDPSHVLLAMGLSETAAGECLRFSVGPTTTEDQIRRAAGLIADAVDRVRQLELEGAGR